MTEETTAIPTITTVDVENIKEHYAKARGQRYVQNVEESIKADAMVWLIENNLSPIVEGREVYRADAMGWTCGFEIQIPLDSREDVEEWVQLVLDAGWKSADKEGLEDKDRVGYGYSNKGNYLQFKFRPGEELLAEVKERFDYEFKYVKSYDKYMRTFNFSEWTIDLHLEFYPTDVADCQITDLGKVKQEREVQVWEVTCKEGAEEMAVIMNGGEDA
jgi:hypothetical protein